MSTGKNGFLVCVCRILFYSTMILVLSRLLRRSFSALIALLRSVVSKFVQSLIYLVRFVCPLIFCFQSGSHDFKVFYTDAQWFIMILLE